MTSARKKAWVIGGVIVLASVLAEVLGWRGPRWLDPTYPSGILFIFVGLPLIGFAVTAFVKRQQKKRERTSNSHKKDNQSTA